MILSFGYDDDGSFHIHMDEEGRDYLMTGLMQVGEEGPGALFTAPSLWEDDAPWWRFWNRKSTPQVGEVRLRHVGAHE